jgi:TRAP-type mannitol/chloroaromatic compound transport system permease small subunit
LHVEEGVGLTGWQVRWSVGSWEGASQACRKSVEVLISWIDVVYRMRSACALMGIIMLHWHKIDAMLMLAGKRTLRECAHSM